MPDSNNHNSAEARINRYFEKFSIWLVGILVAVVGFMYVDTRTRVTALEERVSFLFQDKVSRAEFKEEMNQVRVQIDATKSDIIARLDLYMSSISRIVDSKLVK